MIRKIEVIDRTGAIGKTEWIEEIEEIGETAEEMAIEEITEETMSIDMKEEMMGIDRTDIATAHTEIGKMIKADMVNMKGMKG